MVWIAQTHGGGERTGHTERSTTSRGANPERGVVMSPIVVGVDGSEQALRESAEKQREDALAALDGVAVSPARAGGGRR
jgi:hypothetical protein